LNVKGIIDEDFVNYRKASMFIATSKCSFKCDAECGKCVCQNSELANANNIPISDDDICKRYIDNDITESIVIGGLEPFDTFDELHSFIDTARNKYDIKDEIIIYTGYTETELTESGFSKSRLDSIKEFENIIIKFGRFIPDQKKHFDEVLGVYLSSDNQYAKIIS
jgi:organic radical activating enzyme